MIRITKFDGSSILLNPELIQTIEATPDTVITLTTGLQLVVKNSVEEIVAAFMDYKRSISTSNWEARKAS
ncbi:MAG: flagellar FlbD family protein [Pseudomonadota bacterium]